MKSILDMKRSSRFQRKSRSSHTTILYRTRLGRCLHDGTRKDL